VWRPAADELLDRVTALARETREVPLLSRTHGQPATPTTFGKELAVFVARWRRQLEQLDRQEFRGKLNGAVGTYGALQVADPGRDWERVSLEFVEGLGLTWSPLTTQIEPHDWIAELFHTLGRFNAILVDFDRDVWAYISRGLVRQRVVAGEVGSSTMPHKVNPIDFENSEANAGVSTALGQHMASTLAVSRLQRDLSDSSLLRNSGMVVGHSLLAIRSTLRGLGKIDVDAGAMEAELTGAWEVLAEAVQTVMRKRGGEDPYDQLKGLTRGAGISEERLREFVSGLDLDPADRQRLLDLRPETYVGLAEKLVDHLD
jgi:adenylosuccinate lyase